MSIFYKPVVKCYSFEKPLVVSYETFSFARNIKTKFKAVFMTYELPAATAAVNAGFSYITIVTDRAWLFN